MTDGGRVVIVGFSAAGLSAAQELRRGGHAGELVLVGAESHLPYDRPPLSKQLLSGRWEEDRVALRKEYGDLEADIRLGVRATALDADARVVSLDDGSSLEFDQLVISTGVSARRLSAGHELAGVHVLRTLDDAMALRSELVEGARLVVIGAGYVGTEVAATARSLGVEVRIVDPLPVPVARPFGERIGGLVAALHERNGVVLELGVGVEGIDGADGRVRGVTLSGGEHREADIVLVAVGATPTTDWLDGSGLVLGNGVLCDEYCAAAPGIYAAGDVASWVNARFGVRMRVEHRMNATEQGTAVGRNLLGAGAKFTPIPYFWTDQFDAKIQAYGIFPEGAQIETMYAHPDGGSFVLLYRDDGAAVGAVGWNAPRELRAAREAIDEGSMASAA